MQAIAVALQFVALEFEHRGFRRRARGLDAPFGDVGPVRAVATPRFGELLQRDACARDFGRRARAERGIRGEALETRGQLIVLGGRRRIDLAPDLGGRLGDARGENEREQRWGEA